MLALTAEPQSHVSVSLSAQPSLQPPAPTRISPCDPSRDCCSRQRCRAKCSLAPVSRQPGIARDDPAAPAAVSGAPVRSSALFVDVTPKPSIHVYAPGSKDYIPITREARRRSRRSRPARSTYPKSEIMTFAGRESAGVPETVPADAGRHARQVGEVGSTVTIAGTVNFRRATTRSAIRRRRSPVSWTVAVK